MDAGDPEVGVLVDLQADRPGDAGRLAGDGTVGGAGADDGEAEVARPGSPATRRTRAPAS